MKVLYDYQILYLQRFGGISRYFYELITTLSKNYPDDVFNVKALISQNYYFKDTVSQRQLLKHGNRQLNDLYMKYVITTSDVFKKRIDIIHPTYYEPTYISNIKKHGYKIVLTVHDMIHEHYMRNNKEFIKAKRTLIGAADGIITISEHTKKDLLQLYPELEEKIITTINLGFNKPYVDIDDPRTVLPREYILYVGVRGGYKDFDLMLNTFLRIHERYPDIYLICAGGGGFSSDEKRAIKENGLENNVIQETFSDAGLNKAYSNALCFVYPSEYEGFGLPILEAFSNSCPVLLRRASCFPEVAGDAGLYFDNEEELFDLVKKILDDPDIGKKLADAGQERLGLYSWEKTATKTYDFYQRILKM